MGCFQRKVPVSSFIPFLMIIWTGLLFNEGESRVGGGIKTHGKAYAKDILKIQITTPVPSEIHEIESQNRSLCSIIPSWSDESCVFGPLSIGTDLAPVVYSQLCPRAYGKFRARISCNLFILCHNGSLTVNRCPDSLLFDPISHDCRNSSGNNTCSTYGNASSEFTTDLTKALSRLMDSAGPGGTNPNSREGDKISGIAREANATRDKWTDDENGHERKSHEISVIPYSQPSEQVKLTGNTSSHIPSRESESSGERRYPKEAEVGPCTNFANGSTFPHPNSCAHFIRCVSGKPAVQPCAPGTFFNPQTLACDSETTVPDCNEPMAISTNLARRRTKRSTDSSYANNNVHELLSPPGLSKTSQIILSRKRRSLSPGFSSKLRVKTGRMCGPSVSEEYVQPHPVHCNKFEICSNRRIVEETCGRGTLFNPLSLVCDFPDNVDCESRIVDFSTYDCQGDHEYRASHPETCGQFIECDFGVLKIKTCAPGTLYNGEEEKCDYSYKVKCKKPISLEHDTNVNYIPRPRPRQVRSSRQNSLNLACEYNYIAPHPDFCNQFVECEDGRIFVKSCGPGTVFNGEIGQCDWAYNTKLPDPLDCSQYLHCENGRYTRKSCLGNTIYNPRTKKCVFSQFGAEECRRDVPVNTPPPS